MSHFIWLNLARDFNQSIIEHGESPLETLKREILEEAGFHSIEEPELLTVLSLNQTFSNPTGEVENFHLIGIIYLLKLKEKIIPKPGGDGESSLGCQWFEISALEPEQIVTFVLQSLRSID